MVALSVDNLGSPTKENLLRLVKPVLASKQYGYEDLLSDLVVEAALEVMPTTPSHFNVDSVRVVKILGAGIHDCKVVRGMVFGREPEGQENSARYFFRTSEGG